MIATRTTASMAASRRARAQRPDADGGFTPVAAVDFTLGRLYGLRLTCSDNRPTFEIPISRSVALLFVQPAPAQAATDRQIPVPTAPMGWASWNSFAAKIDYGVIKQQTDAFVAAGLPSGRSLGPARTQRLPLYFLNGNHGRIGRRS